MSSMLRNLLYNILLFFVSVHRRPDPGFYPDKLIIASLPLTISARDVVASLNSVYEGSGIHFSTLAKGSS